jgi:hypothetical protein
MGLPHMVDDDLIVAWDCLNEDCAEVPYNFEQHTFSAGRTSGTQRGDDRFGGILYSS